MPKIIPEPKRYRAGTSLGKAPHLGQPLDDINQQVVSADDYEILREYARLLEAKLNRDHEEDITAEPASSYNALKKQFLSLRSFANAKSSQASFYRSVSEGLFSSRLVCSEDNLESERKANAMLTNLLEESEKRCENLAQEIEGLKRQLSATSP